MTKLPKFIFKEKPPISHNPICFLSFDREKPLSKTKQLNASIVGAIINPMDPYDWWILLCPVVSDHRSSQGSQLLLLILYICPFHYVLH